MKNNLSKFVVVAMFALPLLGACSQAQDVEEFAVAPAPAAPAAEETVEVTPPAPGPVAEEEEPADNTGGGFAFQPGLSANLGLSPQVQAALQGSPLFQEEEDRKIILCRIVNCP